MKHLFALVVTGLLFASASHLSAGLFSKSSVEEDLESTAAEEGLVKQDGADDAKIDKTMNSIEEDIDSDTLEKEDASSSSLFGKAKDTALATAANIDWTNLSWDKVSSIPYDDKGQLLAWAGTQVDTWKEKLTKAAMDKGSTSLANLGDSGWQGALKGVVASLDSVRKSNPDTWDKAKGTLVSSWDTFQKQATTYLTGK